MRISDWSSDVCSSDLRRPDRGKIKRKYRILAIIAIAVARPHRLRDTAVILAHVNISIHVRVIVVHININDRDGRRPCSTTATVAGSPGTAPWQNYCPRRRCRPPGFRGSGRGRPGFRQGRTAPSTERGREGEEWGRT